MKAGGTTRRVPPLPPSGSEEGDAGTFGDLPDIIGSCYQSKRVGSQKSGWTASPPALPPGQLEESPSGWRDGPAIRPSGISRAAASQAANVPQEVVAAPGRIPTLPPGARPSRPRQPPNGIKRNNWPADLPTVKRRKCRTQPGSHLGRCQDAPGPSVAQFQLVAACSDLLAITVPGSRAAP